jgi:serine/threonine protein kinase
MFASKVAELQNKGMDVTLRIRELAGWLKRDTAAHNIRYAARHPPNLQFVKEIASGQTGCVHEAVTTAGPNNLAVKCIDWSTKDQRVSVAKRIATEVVVLSAIQHPLLPKVHQVYNAGDEFCVAMTLCSRGTIWHALREASGHLPIQLVRQYVAELVTVLDLLHKHDIVYVDLKPENVLIQDSDHIMLCDFDLAHTFSEIREIAQAREAAGAAAGPPTFWGTLDYAAPEVVTNGAGAYSPASDWWGVGVLIYEMLLGQPPFVGSTFEEQVDAITRAEIFLPDGPYALDAATENIVLHFLCPFPDERLGSRGVEEIKRHPFFEGIDFNALSAKAAADRLISEP